MTLKESVLKAHYFILFSVNHILKTFIKYSITKVLN